MRKRITNKSKNKSNEMKVKNIEEDKNTENDFEKMLDVINKKFNKIKRIISFNNSHIYISALLVIIGYLFYQLGYSFLYAYYFGGQVSMDKLMDVMVNQIPFDFKLVAIIGAYILTFIVCFCMSLFMYIEADEIESKLLWVLMHILTISALYLIITILVGAKPITSSEEANITIFGVILASSVLAFILFARKSISILIRESISTKSIIMAVKKFIVITMNWILVFWGDDKAVRLIDAKISLGNNIIYNFLFAVILFIEVIIVGEFLDYSIFNEKEKIGIKRHLVTSVEVVPSIILFIWCTIIGKVILIILIITSLFIENRKKDIMEKSKNDSSKDSRDDDFKGNKGDKREEIKKNNKKNKWVVSIPFLIVGTAIFCFYLIAYGIVYDLGNSLGGTLKLNTKSKITYYNTDKDNSYKSLNGIVVQQYGNTYYISTEDRNLVVITSPYVMIEPYNDANKENK